MSTGDDSEDSSAHSNDSISQDDLKHCEHLAEVISIKEEATQSLPDITSPEEVTLTRASGLNLLLYNQADQPVLKVAEVDPDEPMMEGEDDPITIHASSSRNLETQPQQQLQRSREATPSKPAAALLLRALPDPLQQEFELLNTDGLAQIKVEELDLIKRNCKVSASILAKQTMKRLYLRVTFPTEYPDNVPPHFNIGKGTTLASGERHSILKAMKSIAKQQVKRNRTCLEACLRQLELLVDQIQKSGSVLLLQKDSSQTSTPPPFPLAGATAPQDILDGALGNFSDSNIPYPRTCGARFSGNGHLVCFGRSSKSKVLQSSSSGGIPVTPRAYSAFGAHLQMVQQMDAFQGQHKILQSPGNTYGTIRSTQGSSSQNLSQMGSAGDSSSLKRKGRFNVRRVRSGSSDEGKTAPLALRKISTSSAVGPALQESGSVGNSNRSGTQDQLDTMGNAAREGRRASSVVHFCMVESQIVIYDVSKMFLFDKELAAAYVLRQDDAIGVCQDNSSIAARLGKPERAYLWQVCAQIASNVKTLKKTEIPWSKHPMGRPMLMSILNHLVSNHDVQMAAMLTCIFRPKQVVPPIRPTYNIPTLRYNNSSPNKIMNSPTSPKTNHTPSNSPKNSSSSRSSSAEKKAKFWFLKPGALPNISDGSPYHTFSSSSVVSSKKRSVEKNHSKHNHLRTITATMSSLGSDSNLEQFVTPYYKASRSNSWSDPFEEISPISEEAREEDAFATALLDPERQDLYDGLKQAYANILFNWGMLMKRTTVLKAITKQPQKHYGLDMASDCPSCGEKQITGVQCKTAACRAIVMKCAVCRLSVRGLASWCDKCGHGGHFQHWAEWFGAKWGKQKCPTGCGCRCQEEQLLSSQSQESIEPQF